MQYTNICRFRLLPPISFVGGTDTECDSPGHLRMATHLSETHKTRTARSSSAAVLCGSVGKIQAGRLEHLGSSNSAHLCHGMQCNGCRAGNNTPSLCLYFTHLKDKFTNSFIFRTLTRTRPRFVKKSILGWSCWPAMAFRIGWFFWWRHWICARQRISCLALLYSTRSALISAARTMIVAYPCWIQLNSSKNPRNPFAV